MCMQARHTKMCMLFVIIHTSMKRKKSTINSYMYPQKGDFIRCMCLKIATAVDKINKMADCRPSRLERKQGKSLYLFRVTLLS